MAAIGGGAARAGSAVAGDLVIRERSGWLAAAQPGPVIFACPAVRRRYGRSARSFRFGTFGIAGFCIASLRIARWRRSGRFWRWRTRIWLTRVLGGSRLTLPCLIRTSRSSRRVLRSRRICIRGRLAVTSGQPRRLIRRLHTYWRLFRCQRRLRLLASFRNPSSRAQPRTLHIHRITVQRAVDREQSQGTARSLSLVDSSRLQRHGDGISLIFGGVPELSVDENRDRHQRRLAIGRELEHGHGPRPGIFLARRFALAGCDLGPFVLCAR